MTCSGADVLRRADDHPRSGDRCGRQASAAAEPPSTGPGQAEVEQLRPVRRDEDVRGLDVAVHESPSMKRVERAQHAERDWQRLAFGGSSAGAGNPADPEPSPSSSSIVRKMPSLDSSTSKTWQM